MKLLSAIALGLLVISAPATAAMQKPDVSKMTCREATGLVDEAGAILLATGRFTYGIFAKHGGLCVPGEQPPTAYVKTLDNPSCKIGVECVDAVNLSRSGGTSIIGTSVGCPEGTRGRAKSRDKFVINPTEFVCRGGKWEELEI